MNQDADANPCGLPAKYYFDDQFVLKEGATEITIDQTKISHSIDRNSVFKRPDDFMNIQHEDTGDEHFMVWYQTDAFPNFIKLWGRLDEDLKEGTTYSMEITDNFVYENFDIKKYIYFSESNGFGGNNVTFGVLYLVSGLIFFILAMVMIFLEIRDKKPTRNSRAMPGSSNDIS